MAKKKTEEKTVHRPADPNVMGLRGAVVEQPITRTLDENYMPYAMSVIVSRAARSCTSSGASATR